MAQARTVATFASALVVVAFSPITWLVTDLGSRYPESELWVLVVDIVGVIAVGLFGMAAESTGIRRFAKVVVIAGILQFPLFLAWGAFSFLMHPF